MKLVTLNDDVKIQIVGSGTNTFGKVDNQYQNELRGDTQEVDWAIENGYRHFDSAALYNNEEVVGEGLKKSNVPREEFFITTKFNTKVDYTGVEQVKEAIEESLRKLQTDYVDLYLIHFPLDDNEKNLEIWRVLEDFYARGVFKSIGVSNFNEEQLDYLLVQGKVKPAANQIMSNFRDWNDPLIEFHNKNGIATIAWGPLGGIDDDKKKVLEEIGEKYGKTYAQVVLRYQVERNVIVIPKSHNKARQAQSLDIFDFELTADDVARIEEL